MTCNVAVLGPLIAAGLFLVMFKTGIDEVEHDESPEHQLSR